MNINDIGSGDKSLASPRKSYAQWVARAIRLARSRTTPLVSLFESSVPEPKALLRSAVSATIEPEFSQYYASAFGGGNRYVLELIADSYKVSREQVICTTGATGGLALLYRAFARPGDHVLVETPGFDLFQDLADDRGLAIDTFQRKGADYSIDPVEVEALLRPDTRLIVLSNLHNPSGMALDYEVLGKLAAMAERRGALLVVDEVYGDYAGAEARPCPAATLSPAVVSVSSLTKIFGLSTLRCGWIVGAPAVMQVVRNASTRLEFGVSNLAHAVAAQILSNPAPFSDYTGAILAQARPVVEKWVAAMTAEGLVEISLPEAGCIAFPRLVGIQDTEAFAHRLIDRGVILAPGEYFGRAGHVRLGFGLPREVLAPALEILADELREQYRTTTPASAGRLMR